MTYKCAVEGASILSVTREYYGTRGYRGFLGEPGEEIPEANLTAFNKQPV